VNGVGLIVGPSGILGAADTTENNNADQEWYANPFSTPADTQPWVVLNLGGVYDLQVFRMWQYNQSPYAFTVYGAADIELFVSTDATNFTSPFATDFYPTRANATNGEPAQDFSAAVTGVQYVKLQIWASFGGTTAVPGLGAVRFLVDATTAPPVIITQPQNVVATNGGTAAFTVVATNAIGYQWRFNGTNLTDGVNVSGSKTNMLVMSNVSLASEGTYDVVLSNTHGPATSAGAQLVLGSPIITLQPQNWTNIVGQTASFAVAATDYAGNPANVSYQWQQNGVNLTNNSKFSGATTTNLVVSNTTTSDDGNYRAVVTDTIIGKVRNSRNALLTAAPLPTVAMSMVSSQLLLGPNVIAYSSYFSPRTPTNLVNGLDLVAGASGILGAADTTANNSDADMWYSDPFSTPPDTQPWVVFDLGGSYDITTTRLWQYNQAGGFTVYGAADVVLSNSTDNVNYTLVGPDLFPNRAGGTNGEPAQDFSTPMTGTRYIKLQILSSFGGAQATGLSGVRFVSSDRRINVTLDQGVPGLHYQIQYSSSLAPGSWQVLQDYPSLSTSPVTVSDPTPSATQARRFYRVVLML
jgi:hypothetical protein